MSSPRAARTAADLARLRGIIAAMERGGAPPVFEAAPQASGPPCGAGEPPDPAVTTQEGASPGSGLFPQAVPIGADGAQEGPPSEAPGGSAAVSDASGVSSWRPLPSEPSRLPLGARDVDAALGGGLLSGALHEVAGMPGEEGALSAFALGLAVRAAARRRRPVLLACQEMAEWEAGRLHGPGLAAFGLPPEALLLVRVRKPQDVLFVMEEGLKCDGLSVVLGEFLSPVPEVLTATRRLALAAQGSDRFGLMLRHKADPSPCAALTRWRISALPSPAVDGFGGLGAPAFLVRLTRNRFGPTGAWRLMFRAGGFLPVSGGESDHERGGAGAALSQPRFAAPAHGPRRAEGVA